MPESNPPRLAPSALSRTTLAFLGIALVCLLFADLAITTVEPWAEMKRLLFGILSPDFYATDGLAASILYTIAFALLGVTIANVAGLGIALLFHLRVVRMLCAVIRAIHELFWALIFLQLFGLSPLTGVLAIAIPYAGIIAKVYAEILEEADQTPLRAVPAGTSRTSIFLFVRLPDALAHFRAYSLYRLECGLRSSAVLGFIGLPTLGFHLESAFGEGKYSEVAALLLLFYVVIATIRFWVRPRLLPFYLLGAAAVLPWTLSISGSNIFRFLTHDIVPYPLRAEAGGDTWSALLAWLDTVLVEQAVPGIAATIQITMIALVCTGVLALLFFPLISPLLFGPRPRFFGHMFLVITRSTPEYILAFIALQLWGPSMLPAIVALALHNGAIIGHLVGRYTENLRLRQDAATGLDRYAWEVLPRVYRPMLALLFYRWEVILRETAILGILGIATLGFYVDSAFAELRFDRALILIFVTALLNIGVDAASRAIRARLRLQTSLTVR